MAVAIYGPREIEKLRKAGRVAADTLAFVAERLKAGISTAQIDRWVREDTERRGARPSQLGYHGFPAAVCTSRNHVVCHGIPSVHERLEEGDIVNVDVTSELDGFHGDLSETFIIGSASSQRVLVVDIARRALEIGIACVRPDAHLGDIGRAIETFARSVGCGVVRDYGGHGIGEAMHMEPHVSHVAGRGRGLRLRPGMAFTIEPMITIGWPELSVAADDWTVFTQDHTPSAQFEHTVIVTEGGCEITTRSSK